MSTASQFSCLLVGESNLLFRCADMLEKRGHEICALVTRDEIAGGSRKTYKSIADARAELSGRPDLVFSIVNRTILSHEDIAWPRIVAINYHDSPLPAYAGVNAPSWAILNGESQHGVTWHLVTKQVDAGDILAQSTFPIAEEDTALSLSAKCFEHALSTFGELLDRIELGPLHGRRQDLSKRTCFVRPDRLPRQGIIRWTDCATDICRFVRSAQIGPYANDFGLPKILLSDGSLAVVGQARVLAENAPEEPGTVVDVSPHSIEVATGDGRLVSLQQLSLLNGRGFAFPPHLKGSRFPILSPTEEEKIAATTVLAARQEDATVAALRNLPPAMRAPGLRPYKYNAPGEHVFEGAIDTQSTSLENFARILQRLMRANEDRPFTVGIARHAPRGFMPARPFACRGHDTSKIAEALHSDFAAAAIPADLPARFPELHEPQLRMDSISTILSAEEHPPAENPGLIVHCHAGRLALRFDARQVSKADAQDLAAFLFDGTKQTANTQAGEIQFIQQRIAHWAAQTPDATAIESRDQKLTYAELWNRSGDLARRLRDCGADKESLIGVLLPQSIDFVTSIVGVLRSGAAYLPLEVSTPLHRLRDMVRDSRPVAVVTDKRHMDLAAQLGITVLSVDNTAPVAQPKRETESQADDLAYVLYTSGSTGEPKASMIEHGALAGFIASDIERNQIAPGDRVLQLCSTAFDASVEEVFSALGAGATLVIKPPTLLDSADAFLDFCEQERLTIIGVYSSMLGDILEAMERRGHFPATVRLATTGGEMVRAEDAQKWRRFFAERNCKPPTFLNVYGLTETTVANCASDLSQQPELTDKVPIGRPLPGNRFRIVSSDDEEVASDEVGELLIAGPQLARAYWNRPEINAKRFFTDASDGSRWFRTGDLVHQSAAGELYFGGRIDRQVKVSGVRIELEDIERAMQSCAEITHAAAILHRLPDGRELLAAFFTPFKEGLEAKLRKHLEQRLPASMRPRRLVALDAFPVNDRGKTDYSLLGDALDRESGGGAPPTNQKQDTVMRVWKEFFAWSDVDNPEESFFDLGGDSLTAVRLLFRLEQETGIHLPVSSFFRDPNLAGLRRMLRTRKQGGETFDPLLPLKIGGNKTPIYVLHGGNGDVAVYSTLVEHMSNDRQVFGVRSAAVLGGRELPNSMEQAATDVVATIIKHRPRGPWILLGWSWAGTLAYETALQLYAQTGLMPVIIMIDALAPLKDFTKTERAVHYVRRFPRWAVRSWLGARLLKSTRKALLGLPSKTRAILRRGATGAANRIPPSFYKSHFGGKMIRAGQDIISRLSDPEPKRFPGSPTDPTEHHFRLARSYKPGRHQNTEIHLIRAAKHAIPPFHPDIHFGWKDNGWRRATGCTTHSHLIRSCNHNELLREPKCTKVASLIESIASETA